MYVYDLTNQLARTLSESPEFKALKAAKEKVSGSPTTINMLKDFKKRQFELQAMQLSGQKMDEEKMSQFQNLYQVIMMNPDVAEYLQAEFKFGQIMTDIYNIIAKAVEIDLDFLEGIAPN